jgi:hypothetical protein
MDSKEAGIYKLNQVLEEVNMAKTTIRNNERYWHR